MKSYEVAKVNLDVLKMIKPQVFQYWTGNTVEGWKNLCGVIQINQRNNIELYECRNHMYSSNPWSFLFN